MEQSLARHKTVLKGLSVLLLLANVLPTLAIENQDGQEVSSDPAFKADPLATSSAFASPTALSDPGANQPLMKGYVRTLDTKYLLSPGDQVKITVFNAPEYDQGDMVIRPDGYISVKPFGEMKVSGMDVSGFKALLETRLSLYLKAPEIAVSVTEFHPAIVYVLGAVNKPGAYEVHGDMDKPNTNTGILMRSRLTVSNLVANAGGITEDADLTQVLIKNNQSGEVQTVDLIKLIKEGDTAQDVMVHSGDSIQIPRNDRPGQMDDETYKLLTGSALSAGSLTVRVLGQVDSPGVYTISAQNAGVNTAIASAKGYKTEADKHVLKVYRMNPNGQLSAIMVDPFKHDFVLRNNDLVYVEERGLPVGGRGFDYVTRTLMPFTFVAQGVNDVLDIFNPTRRFRRFFPPTN